MHKFAYKNNAVDRPAQRAPQIRALALALAFTTGMGALSGCTVCQNVRRTVWFEPIQFPWKFDRQRSLKAYRSWAEQAWQTESGTCPQPASEHYVCGFKDGFVDFVYAGGDGQPPPVPPRNYWNLAWRSPQGHSAADEWFAGYRHGAKAARAGGYRNLGIVYSSLRSGGRQGWSEQPMLMGPLNESEDLGPARELLPAPSSEPVVPEKAEAAPAKDAAAAVPEAPAPRLGPPAIAADVAEPPTVPPPPAPPENQDVAPKEVKPEDAPQGAALQFRRAISAAASTLQLNASRSSQSVGGAGVAPVKTQNQLPDTGPPQWPDPAVGVEPAMATEIAPPSASLDSADAPFAPRPKNLASHE